MIDRIPWLSFARCLGTQISAASAARVSYKSYYEVFTTSDKIIVEGGVCAARSCPVATTVLLRGVASIHLDPVEGRCGPVQGDCVGIDRR